MDNFNIFLNAIVCYSKLTQRLVKLSWMGDVTSHYYWPASFLSLARLTLRLERAELTHKLLIDLHRLLG
jgi:hypothetical protein